MADIWQVLPRIIGDISPISKDRENKSQGYKFRGIDDVYAALNLLLAKYGVTIVPEVLESHHEVSGVTKSGSSMYRHTVRIRYTLYASDGSSVKADSEGEGMDTGDKATPKAFSTAFKTMAFQVFCIPTGEKIDTEEDSPEVVAPPTNGKPAAQPPKAAAPKTDPASEALCEEHRQAIAQARDEDAIKKIGATASGHHKAHAINDIQFRDLKKAADARRAELGIVTGVRA